MRLKRLDVIRGLQFGDLVSSRLVRTRMRCCYSELIVFRRCLVFPALVYHLRKLTRWIVDGELKRLSTDGCMQVFRRVFGTWDRPSFGGGRVRDYSPKDI